METENISTMLNCLGVVFNKLTPVATTIFSEYNIKGLLNLIPVSVDFSLSGFIFPAGSRLMKILSFIHRRTGVRYEQESVQGLISSISL